jgi:transposase
MPPPRYPSDLSDQEWEILQPLLSSPEKRGCPPKWPLKHVADAVFYLLRRGCSWRMLPRKYPTQGRRSTITSASGGSTDGCAEPTTGCERLCSRKGRARARPQRGGDRQPGGEDYPGGRPGARLQRGQTRLSGILSATSSWWTRVGWCWPRGSMAPTYPIGMAGDDC